MKTSLLGLMNWFLNLSHPQVDEKTSRKENHDQNNSIQAIWPLKTTKRLPSDVSTRNFQMEPVNALEQGEKRKNISTQITNSWVPAVSFVGVYLQMTETSI